MSESERRRTLPHTRVLIETERILSPQFDDAVLFLTGAQIELLRNVTQYLNRISTYVSEYGPGYYLTPTIEDYDSILAIVADLEETIMGNPNKIWGYTDRWCARVTHTMVGSGTYTLASDEVPDGYTYTVQSLAARNWNREYRTIPKLRAGAVEVPIGTSEIVGAGGYRILIGIQHTLKHTDKVVMTFYECVEDDFLEMLIWGYKMNVPES